MAGHKGPFDARPHGRTSEAIEESDGFFVRCDCGYETPTFDDEDAAWARHDKHVDENGGFPWA